MDGQWTQHNMYKEGRETGSVIFIDCRAYKTVNKKGQFCINIKETAQEINMYSSLQLNHKKYILSIRRSLVKDRQTYYISLQSIHNHSKI